MLYIIVCTFQGMLKPAVGVSDSQLVAVPLERTALGGQHLTLGRFAAAAPGKNDTRLSKVEKLVESADIDEVVWQILNVFSVPPLERIASQPHSGQPTIKDSWFVVVIRRFLAHHASLFPLAALIARYNAHVGH